ncbi:MAG TPA: NmrA/HSCARG family protein [Steroidobacteraceae bacterium]|nr:NmrA/HSCARG family protein [Steroidobacteraceae bacterium]
MSTLLRILVVGATGAQGGSVARHLLRTGSYKVRCLTRRPGSPAAKEIAELGAELVEGDLSNPAGLRAALSGCDGAFCVTNYWEHFEREFEHGRNFVDGLAASGIQHAVISTLPHVKLLSGGRLGVPHFDTKGRIEEYARSAGVPATYVHVAFYYENFLSYFPPRRQSDGTYVFGFPQGSTPLAGVAAEDVGGVVAAIFAESFWYRDKVVGVVGDDMRCDDYAEIMHRVLRRPVAYRYIAHDAFAALGFPGARDLADMFEFNRQYVPNRRLDLAKSRELYPEIRPFERWLRSHAPAFERALAS